MSAYMVDRNHVAYLVESYAHFVRQLSPAEKVSLGQMLWDENRKSIETRYPDTIGDDEHFSATAPGPCDETYRYGPHQGGWHRFDKKQLHVSIACYNYQSCEHQEWEKSDVYRMICVDLCQAIGMPLDTKLDQRGSTIWGAPEPDIMDLMCEAANNAAS